MQFQCLIVVLIYFCNLPFFVVINLKIKGSFLFFLIQQEHMIVLTRTTGQKLLFEGRHEQAVPAAMQSLRFAIDVHGLASIELVPSYLILGEASIGE
jgi:hypothetical protein